MPPRTKKREAEEYEEDDFVANDGDSDGPVIRSKKPKTATTTTTTTTSSRGAGAGSSKAANGGLVDSNGDVYWELSRLRRVTVSQFKGKTMVNVREYYERDGEELPGKKVRWLCMRALICGAAPPGAGVDVLVYLLILDIFRGFRCRFRSTRRF